jgi:hypothetical protein
MLALIAALHHFRNVREKFARTARKSRRKPRNTPPNNDCSAQQGHIKINTWLGSLQAVPADRFQVVITLRQRAGGAYRWRCWNLISACALLLASPAGYRRKLFSAYG